MKEKMYLILGVGIIGLLFYQTVKNDIVNTAGTIIKSVDPTSDENIFYRGVNKIGAVLTGQSSFNLGHWIYDVWH